MKVMFVIFLLLCMSFVSPVLAAKPRVRTVVGKTGSAPVTTGYSKAKLSRATNSVIVTFINLGAVQKINYTLSYTSNTRSNPQQQGAVGSVTPNGASTDSRDLYFGTCSHGVCTPHYQITGAVLLVETTLKSGGTNVKRYRIKI